MIMAGSGGGALRCRPGGLEEGLKTCFECDDRLMDTTQTGRERSRNISRSLQGHDPLERVMEDGETRIIG
jgi:hypothetical protein